MSFDLEINFDVKDLTNKMYNLICSIDINSINKINLLDTIFSYYLENENLAIIKDYIKFYNKKNLTNWIFNLAKLNMSEQTKTVFIGNTKINSYFDNIVNDANNKNILDKIQNNVYGHQQNKIINSLQVLNSLLVSGKSFKDNFSSNDLLLNDFNFNINNFDFIFFDFPSGIHNVIHANCCDKIKKLKLRGTKSEPLLLQFIMTSLNKNGRSVLVVPDSLLFSDSIQPIETRKYLLENFNVKKVINIDESLYVGRGIKNSILYFENNGSTSKTQFSKIYQSEDVIEEAIQATISIGSLKQNIYSLYWKNYELTTSRKLINKIETNEFNQLFQFKSNNDDLPNENFICLEKYYKNDKSIFISSTKHENCDHYIMLKNKEDNDFNIKLLENILKTRYLNLVKGKMNQFDITKIEKLEIPIIDVSIKNSVYEYINITNQIILDNNEKIINTEKLKKCLINSLNFDKMISLDSICQLYDKKSDEKQTTSKLIGVIRNGLSAGSVYMLDDNNKISTNSHYIKLTNKDYLVDFVYHYLKHNEEKLKQLANLNPQPNLSQSNFLNFKIPTICMENQIEIIEHCNTFDSVISKYVLNNKSLTEKNIMSTILKLNNFI